MNEMNIRKFAFLLVLLAVISIDCPARCGVPRSIRVLAIGNSFSTDAVEQNLAELLMAAGVDTVIIGNMYIGGCPLWKHAVNAQRDSAAYSYRKIVNGEMAVTPKVRLSEALQDEDWDYVSVQEGAGFHGYYNREYKGVKHSMEPDLTFLIEYVSRYVSDYKLIYHVPWAAKQGSESKKFGYYDMDQALMYRMIREAAREVVSAHPEIDIVMNDMDAIQNARKVLGDTLDRDGWHLSYGTGRYTAACLWCEKLLGRSVVGNRYYPADKAPGVAPISAAEARACQRAAHSAARR